jgi:hypothetical protein
MVFNRLFNRTFYNDKMKFALVSAEKFNFSFESNDDLVMDSVGSRAVSTLDGLLVANNTINFKYYENYYLEEQERQQLLQQSQERLAAEKAEQERPEQERLAAEKAEQDRAAAMAEQDLQETIKMMQQKKLGASVEVKSV